LNSSSEYFVGLLLDGEIVLEQVWCSPEHGKVGLTWPASLLSTDGALGSDYEYL
jgi:hypothetical protein